MIGSIPIAVQLSHVIAGVAAAIWAGALVWRYPRLGTERIVVSVIGIVALILFALGVFAKIPDIEKLLQDISGALGKWTYLLVGVLAFLETGAFVGLVAPGETAVIIGGVVAGQGEIDIRVLIGLVWLAAFLGDATSYLIGKRLGREFIVKHGPRVKITVERLEQVEKYMAVHGGKTILIGRFVGLVRALAPFIAGASRMPFRSFAPYDIIGSGLWAATFCLIGYIFSQNLGAVIDYAGRGTLILGWTIAIVVALVYLVRRFRNPEERARLDRWLDRHERDHPGQARVIRPLRRIWRRFVIPAARWTWPKLRFTLDRLTPGGLGLEFTTVAAVFATSAYTYYFFVVGALGWPDNTFDNKLNNAAFRVVDGIRADWLDQVARVVTYGGALYVVGAVVLAATLICLRKRRFAEAAVLVSSLIATVAIVHLTKNAIEIPRPPQPLSGFGGWAFPSGHAAYAVSYVTVALTLTRVGLMVRAALVLIGVLIGGAIALSRVYLRVHYLTDVIGGTAVGFMSVAFFACLALLIVHLNDRRRNFAGVDSSTRPAGPGNDDKVA